MGKTFKGDEIKVFIGARYQIEHPTQTKVVNLIVGYSKARKKKFTDQALRYLISEVTPASKLKGMSENSVVFALNRMLNYHQETRFKGSRTIGSPAIKTIVSAIGCPKPWC